MADEKSLGSMRHLKNTVMTYNSAVHVKLFIQMPFIAHRDFVLPCLIK